jgi:hypothetical protein
MKGVVPILGWALFLFCCGRVAGDYGTHWKCGRYFMPKTIVGSDGYSYPDGEPIPAVMQMLVQAGIEEEVNLGLACGLAASLVWLAVEVRKLLRVRRKYGDTFGRDFIRS